MALFDLGGAIDFSDFGALCKSCIIGAKAHGAALVIAHFAFNLVVALDPFLQVINHRRKAFLARFVVKLLRACVVQLSEVARSLNDRHLHPKANTQIWHFAFAGELRGLDLALGPAFAKATGHKDRVEAFQVRGRVFAVKEFGIDPLNLDLDPVCHAAVGQGLSDGFVGVF